MSFGSQLKKALFIRGLTQRDLAFMCDITESNISRWCMNKTSPHIKDIIKICEALNCSSDWLLEIIRTDNFLNNKENNKENE